MTKKTLNPLEDPPAASSSDEDEVEALSGDDEEEQISDEEDDLMNPVNIPSAKISKSEKLIAVTKSKPNDTKKRPIETTYVNAKRAKIAEETKKPLFQRLWSEEDEISVLQGIIDFKADTGKSPYEDMDRFYELTIKSISFEASKLQFMDKIRSLKRKYMGKVMKGVESLTKAHDIECLKLAKYIWGSHGMALDSNVKKSEKKVVQEEELVTPESTTKPNGTPKKSKKKKSISVEGNGDKVEEDREVLVTGDNGGEDTEVLVSADKVKRLLKQKKSEKKLEKPHSKDMVEEEEELVALESPAKSNGAPKKSEKKKKPISVDANGGKDRDVLGNGDKVEEDREVLVTGDNRGEDREVLLANGDKVEEDKEVLINGGGASKSHGVRVSDWFEDSFLVGSIAGLGVSERFVKERWSMVTEETKKRMEEKWKLLQAKEMELVLHKTDFMREIGSVIAEAS